MIVLIVFAIIYYEITVRFDINLHPNVRTTDWLSWTYVICKGFIGFRRNLPTVLECSHFAFVHVSGDGRVLHIKPKPPDSKSFGTHFDYIFLFVFFFFASFTTSFLTTHNGQRKNTFQKMCRRLLFKVNSVSVQNATRTRYSFSYYMRTPTSESRRSVPVIRENQWKNIGNRKQKQTTLIRQINNAFYCVWFNGKIICSYYYYSRCLLFNTYCWHRLQTQCCNVKIRVFENAFTSWRNIA